MDAELAKKILAEADRAGTKAGAELCPRPMIIREGIAAYVETEGECGCAWIALPAGSAFARILCQMDLVGKNLRFPWFKDETSREYRYHINHFEQSYQRGMAYAKAFVAVLKAHGIDEARPGGRLT